MSSVAGKVIVVSGGTQGLGEAVARTCAAGDAAGLVLAGRSRDRGEALAAALTTSGTSAIYVAADISDPAAAAAIGGAADARFGVVHGLVNVAAATARDNIWTATPDGWDAMFAVNVRAPFFLAQGCARIMRREGVAGSIVSVGSLSGYGGAPYLASYSVSKGALNTMTKSLSYALMRHHIRVNSVNPGWMETESEDAIQRSAHGAQDGWLDAAAAGQPMGRLVQPDEVARTITFCLSDESGLLTGAIIDFDQGVIGAGDVPKPTVADTPM